MKMNKYTKASIIFLIAAIATCFINFTNSWEIPVGCFLLACICAIFSLWIFFVDWRKGNVDWQGADKPTKMPKTLRILMIAAPIVYIIVWLIKAFKLLLD